MVAMEHVIDRFGTCSINFSTLVGSWKNTEDSFLTISRFTIKQNFYWRWKYPLISELLLFTIKQKSLGNEFISQYNHNNLT